MPQIQTSQPEKTSRPFSAEERRKLASFRIGHRLMGSRSRSSAAASRSRDIAFGVGDPPVSLGPLDPVLAPVRRRHVLEDPIRPD